MDDYQAPEGSAFWIKFVIMSLIFSIIIILITKKQDILYRFLYVVGGVVGAYLAISGKFRRKGFVERGFQKRGGY